MASMTATGATAQRDALMPRRPRGLGMGFVLAILAHVLLILALALSVNWHTRQPQGIQAELWSAVPQAAAPRLTAPEPAPAPKPVAKPLPEPPKPVVKAAPEPTPPDPQIAIEKAKREEAKREQAREDQQQRDKQQRDQQLRDQQLREQQQRDQQQQREKQQAQADAQRAQRDAAAQAAARADYLKRMMGQAGATGGPTDTGRAQRSSGPSASYAGRVAKAIYDNLIFSGTVPGDPVATVDIRVAADGRILSRRLVKSSGVSSFDDAILRAIDRVEKLPTDVNGVPPEMAIDFTPNH